VCLRVGDVSWPPDTSLVAILRSLQVIAPSPDDPLETGDELLFVSSPDQEEAIQALLSP
jgi:trk system potassium uptake protein